MLFIFETYQTFFTGLLGFTGVIITMIANSRHQVNLQNRAIEHEARALRIALKSELVANRNIFNTRIKQFNEPSDFQHALLPSNTVTDVYHTLLEKIGALTEEEIEVIFKAYQLIEELPYRLRILIGTDNVGGFNNEFLRIDKSRQSVATGIHKNFLGDINKAINVIDKQLSA